MSDNTENPPIWVVLHRGFEDAVARNAAIYVAAFDSEDKAEYFIYVCISEGAGYQSDYYIRKDILRTQKKVY